MMKVGMNRIPFFASEYDIVQIVFDSKDEFDAFIDSINNFINMEKNVQTDTSKSYIADLVQMLNVHLTEEDDGTVWTYILSFNMPAVFLAFCNCVGLFNVFYDSVKSKLNT